MDNEQTCIFIGHRIIPRASIQPLITRLDSAIESLVKQNVTTFISGGALGFDLVASALVVFKKERYRHIRLCFALPCREATRYWRDDQKRFLQQLQAEADRTIYVSEQHQIDCVEKQRRYLVDHAAYCLCALLKPSAGIEQTLDYAKERKVRLIDIAERSWLIDKAE
ncbi:MAG TPA: DUF1273 domain-containing protein [Firmicutes bacterium]|nr:DUF1273 domain-containing protein [Bacillota bacterium]